MYTIEDLLKAVEEDDEEKIIECVQNGVNINNQDDRGYTPLIIAARDGRENAVHALLSAGAEVNLFMEDKYSALHYACITGKLKITKMLLDYRADIRQQNKWNQTSVDVSDFKLKMYEKGLDNENRFTAHQMAERYKSHQLLTQQPDKRILNRMDKNRQDLITLGEQERAKILEETMMIFRTKYMGTGTTKVEDMNPRTYLQCVEDGKEIYRHIRVMFVGSEGVGKTTLCLKLIEKRPEQIQSTNGIEIFTQMFKVFLKQKNWKRKENQSEEDKVLDRLHEALQQQLQSKFYPTTNVSYTENRNIVTFPVSDLTSSASSEERDTAVKSVSGDQATDDPYSIQSQFDAIIEQMTALNVNDERDATDITAYMSFWDFGGQEVFKASHHVFLSSAAVYLVVFNILECMENESKIKSVVEWIQLIKTYSPPDDSAGSKTPPIILVGTHLDKIQGTESQKRKCVREVFQKIISSPEMQSIVIFRTFPVNNMVENYSDERFQMIRDAILEAAQYQSDWERELPVKWIMLEKALMIKKSEGVKVMTISEIKRLNTEGISPVPEEQLPEFLKYLHTSRTAIYFNNEDACVHTTSHANEETKIILDLQWLVNAFKCLITADDFVDISSSWFPQWCNFKKSDQLEPSLIEEIWTERGFIEHKHLLLTYMDKLGLLTHSKDQMESKCQSPNCYIVPSMLKDLDSDWLASLMTQDSTVKSKSLFVVFSEKFVPSVIFDKTLAAFIEKYHRLIRCGIYTDKCLGRGFGCFTVDALWKVVLLCKGSAISLTMFNQSGQNLDPEVGTRLRQELLQILRRILVEHRQENLHYDLGLYCKNHLSKQHMPLKIKDLQKHRTLKCCQESTHGESHFLYKSDLYAWYREIYASSCEDYGSLTTIDNTPSLQQIGRIARAIDQYGYRALFEDLGLPRMTINMITGRFLEHCPATIIAHVLHVYINSGDRPTIRQIIDGMNRHDMKTSGVLADLKRTDYQDADLPLSPEILDSSPSVRDLETIAGYLQFRDHQLLFMELGVTDVMKTTTENNEILLKEQCYRMLLSWKRSVGEILTTVRALLCAMNSCGMENIVQRTMSSLYLPNNRIS